MGHENEQIPEHHYDKIPEVQQLELMEEITDVIDAPSMVALTDAQKIALVDGITQKILGGGRIA